MTKIFHPLPLFAAGVLCLATMTVVLATALTLGSTLKSKIMRQGTAGNIIVVDAGADTPMFSSLPPETYDLVRSVPHIARHEGQPMVNRCLELASLVYGHFTVVKGVDPLYFRMIDQARLVAGRLPAAGNEVIAGTLLPAKVGRPIGVGDKIPFEGEQWEVVGLFEDRLTVMGSGIVASLADIQRVTNRNHLSFVTLKAEAAENMGTIKDYIDKTYEALLRENPEAAGVMVAPEVDYYLYESEAINPLVLFFGLISALYLLVGAMIVYNIADSMTAAAGATALAEASCQGCGRGRLLTAGLRTLAMGLAAGLLAWAAVPFFGKISINFMMMTFHLDVPAPAVAAGALMAGALGLAASQLAARPKVAPAALR